MAFNFLEIKKLGTIYRALEEAIKSFPTEGLQKTADIIGAQILSKSDIGTAEGHRTTIYCSLQEFPRPAYSIGEYVEYIFVENLAIDFGRKHRGIIIGMAYHQKPETIPTGWWYDIRPDHDPIEHECLHQHMIIGLVPIWESPNYTEMNEETQALLDSFLTNFEKSHGLLFPEEQESA
ncbi:MAG: hypothetical protein J7545_15585 [Roseofilum sp. SBFL]|uniref:hypothetical protein n=1 Tax=Roseofilum sp. SBFL TaxID=2821496 RepID=UPI001B151557|nr:hypothetical protein [Roseofilum sp. SBFL]MBP0043369.1 hypothetical protein [Roseofilum sp. SBFL]